MIKNFPLLIIEDLVLLQKEFRMATNNWVYNFPAGLIDEGETPEEAAIRELKEEGFRYRAMVILMQQVSREGAGLAVPIHHDPVGDYGVPADRAMGADGIQPEDQRENGH